MAPILALLLLAGDCPDSPVDPDRLDPIEHPEPQEASGAGLYIGGIAFSADDVAMAKPSVDPLTDEPVVHIQFWRAGLSKFADAQRCRLNRPMEVSFDRRVLTRPMLREEIIGGVVLIQGGFTAEDAATLAARIKPEG